MVWYGLSPVFVNRRSIFMLGSFGRDCNTEGYSFGHFFASSGIPAFLESTWDPCLPASSSLLSQKLESIQQAAQPEAINAVFRRIVGL
ncbi:MAG TPA: hypothetical protein DD706_06790 [Nitrospiraceae bacterium]|nr:hypothetical protein [Nitrospiraceae bacterium]